MIAKSKVTNAQELKTAMEELETRVKLQEADIKLNFSQIKENLHPKKVIRNTFSYLAETPEIQRTLLNTVFGFVLGYASKKAVQLLSEQSLDRTVKNIVSTQLTNLENKEPNGLLSKGITLIRKYTPPTSPIYPFIKY